MATPIDKIETSYLKKGDHATNIPSSLRFWDKPTSGFKDKLNYVYDKLGNISKICENGKLLVRYAYDGVNRLIREDNRDFNESYFFSYDKTGNITSKRTCPFTLEETEKISTFTSEDVFAYDGDKLIAKNNLLCAYTNGRPTTYLGKAVTFKEKGLISSFNGVSFDYDNLGRRTVKGAWAYTYNSDDDLVSLTNGTTTLTYFYADTGEPLGFKKDNTSYFFRRNLQGDIIAILDSSGNVVVKYVYDAWGNHKVLDANGVEITDTTHVGHVNPIRYRGYYYDVETGLYYLQSRYYDPEVGRFISPDSVDYLDPDSINGLNLYAYCGNNPVMNVDPTGHFFLTFILGLILSGVVIRTFVSTVGFVGSLIASIWDETIRQDLERINYNPFNADEGLVLKSQKVSFYKGSFVIRHDIKGATSCGVLGMIFLNKSSNTTDLKHEFGHNMQELLLGTPLYLLSVAIPSIIYCYNGEYLKYVQNNPNYADQLYYSKVWERTADLLGGVKRSFNYLDLWQWSNFSI